MNLHTPLHYANHRAGLDVNPILSSRVRRLQRQLQDVRNVKSTKLPSHQARLVISLQFVNVVA